MKTTSNETGNLKEKTSICETINNKGIKSLVKNKATSICRKEQTAFFTGSV